MIIEIYSKDQCPYCDMAVRKAQAMIQETSEHTYSVKKLGVDFGREEMLETFPTARTFPQIKIDGQPIGGWTEFQKI
jgi:glutaredoxin 3